MNVALGVLRKRAELVNVENRFIELLRTCADRFKLYGADPI
jgi:hypothetical protein